MAALTPAVFHILLALAQGERHGYGILKDVLTQTDGDVRLGPGTLYGTLQRLMESGLVEEVSGPAADPGHDERRRYYRITKAGRRALGADVDRMDRLVRSARATAIVPATVPRLKNRSVPCEGRPSANASIGWASDSTPGGSAASSATRCRSTSPKAGATRGANAGGAG